MIKNIKGTKDLLPNATYNIQDIEQHLNTFMNIHGYGEIRTPIFESTELFSRSVGEHTDIVNKEMYTWEDQNGHSLTLRPEMTASVVRSYIQNKLWKQEPISKFFYIGPSFRRERPQKGRLRQFHQFGVEALGSKYPEQDAEVISMAYNIYHMFGLDHLSVKINSLGGADIKSKYGKALQKSMVDFKDEFNEQEWARLNNNPLRILDTKNKNLKKIINKNAPNIFDFISIDDKKHFNKVTSILNSMNIPYEHDVKLVRGLDYYSKTVFELTSSELGAQDALCGGGRYDNLVSELGGANIPAIGFAAGMERLIIAMKLSNNDNINTDIYIINTEENYIEYTMALADKLRKEAGIAVHTDTLRRSIKSQMRHANKMNAKYSIIINKELFKNSKKLLIKNMSDNTQEEISEEKIINFFQSE